MKIDYDKILIYLIKSALILKLILLFSIVSITNTNAKIYRLNNSPQIPSDFKDIYTALQQINTGDTIYAEGSSMKYGDLIINKKVTIIGTGYNLAENAISECNSQSAEFTNLLINSGAEGSNIVSLVFNSDSSSNQNVYIRSNDITVKRCLFKHNLDISLDTVINNLAFIQNYTSESILAKKTAVLNNILISNNVVIQSIKFPCSSKINITNNVVRKIINANNSMIANNIQLDENTTKTFTAGFSGTNNIYKNNITKNTEAKYIPSGASNILGVDMATVFQTYEDDFTTVNDSRWKLKIDSPAKKAGFDGADCGVFGGSIPYVLSGIPPIPIITDIIIDNSSQDNDFIKLKIKVK